MNLKEKYPLVKYKKQLDLTIEKPHPTFEIKKSHKLEVLDPIEMEDVLKGLTTVI